MQEEQLQTRDTLLETHSWYESQLDALHFDLLKLRSAPQAPSAAIVPEYVELSCQKLFIRSSAPLGQPLGRYDQAQMGKNTRQVFQILFALLDTAIWVHQQGCVMRQIAVENILVGKAGYKVVAFLQETI